VRAPILATTVTSLTVLFGISPLPLRTDPPSTLPKDLDATLRKLEGEIIGVRGLRFKSPVAPAKRTGGKAVTVGIMVGGKPEKPAADPVTYFVIVAK
jgi:hypothetical protein